MRVHPITSYHTVILHRVQYSRYTCKSLNVPYDLFQVIAQKRHLYCFEVVQQPQQEPAATKIAD